MLNSGTQSKGTAMKLAIVGSRDFNNYRLLHDTLLEKFHVGAIEEIVSGGAHGADSLGKIFAEEYSIPTKIFYPEWGKYGKRAGYLRNIDIVDRADTVIAFWDGQSKGTNHTINLARKQNKDVVVIRVEKKRV